jgi:hypothetical protein
MIKFRASSISTIMTDAKKADEPLSEGAKTALNQIAKEYVYGYNKVISGKEMEKGIICEDQSIELYNSVFFTAHKKNAERKSNEWVTGECDIFVPEKKIIDIKTSWSLATFPASPDVAAKAVKEAGYDWQGRVYMMLWDVDQFQVAYCMVSTPDELIKYEQEDLHYVDHIEEALRVTTVNIERDDKLEKKIITKVQAARDYLNETVEKIRSHHNVLEAA